MIVELSQVYHYPLVTHGYRSPRRGAPQGGFQVTKKSKKFPAYP